LKSSFRAENRSPGHKYSMAALSALEQAHPENFFDPE
jgi:hypothetical protein